MKTTQTAQVWGRYVAHITQGKRQDETAKDTGVNQATISRWVNGKKVPTEAAVVAHFARTLGRNPLEAFVAAGMLQEDEAGRGLADESRKLLAGLRSLAHQ